MTPPSPPSAYESQAWIKLQEHRTGRKGTRPIHDTAQKVAASASRAGARGEELLQRYEAGRRAKSALEKGAQRAASGARRASEATPQFVAAARGAGRAVVRVTQVGLTPDGVVKKHTRRGHAVASLADLHEIDLEEVDKVVGRNRDLAYSAFAAAVGGASSLVITGGELAVVAGGGAGSAPGVGAIAGAFAADTALVLAAASRAVGEISLLYGYDPTDPTEKPFVLSVVNLGTAATATTRAAALADLSRVTQLLLRGATWKQLNRNAVPGLTRAFATRFGVRLTKKGLGKALPGVGIFIGTSLNWLTLEQIVDSANIAYRRRWIIEKYPHLATDDGSLDPTNWQPTSDGDVEDEPISVIEVLEQQGWIDADADDVSDSRVGD